MGLFSTRKQVFVSSTAYNMAGEFALRPNYLKTTMFRGIIRNAPSLAEEIIDGQFQGPNIDQRLFFRWARNNFPEGAVSGSISNRQMLTAAQQTVAAGAIATAPGEDLQISYAFIDDADISFWAERHILTTRPADYTTNWISDYDDATSQLKIVYADASEELVAVPDFNRDADYLYVLYNTLVDSVTGAWMVDNIQTDLATRPDTTGWTQDSYSETVVTETLADGAPGVTRTEDVTDSTEVLTRTVYLGKQGSAVVDRNERITIWKRHRIITTAPDTEAIEVYYDATTEIQDVTRQDTGVRNVFIYEIGSGNATLDALQVAGATIQEFYPIIPMRHYNRAIDDPVFAAEFPQFKKAYRRAIGTKIEKALADIEAIPDIGDVDHAFLTFGAEINTGHKEGLRYIYEFLKELSTNQLASPADVTAWAGAPTYADYLAELQTWEAAQTNPTDPLFGTPQPAHVSYPIPDTSTLEIKSTATGLAIPYDVRLQWVSIDETAAAGQGKVGAIAGDFWWEVMPAISDPNYVDPATIPAGSEDVSSYFRDTPYDLDHVRLYWQVTGNSYTYLDVYGLRHVNRVYDGKAVTITAVDGIQDTDESGFVVPLHYPTLKKLPLVWSNELGIQNRILIFNSYQVVKQRWWERGIFRILLVVVMIVISAIVFPGGVGILGSHLTVGTALGFAGTTALIAGAVANALVAIILTQTVSFAATELFGEKFGALVAALASFVMGNMAANFAQTGNMAVNWSLMSRAETILGLTDAVGKGLQGFAAAEIKENQEEIKELREDYQTQMDEITERFLELGYSGIEIDPLMFTEQGNSGSRSFESSDAFIQRTLLTGSDIAEMTLTMIGKFPELTLTLPDPIE